MAYLRSDGGPAARAALLQEAWWHRPFPDGRSSEAVLALIEAVRVLRARGLDVTLLAFAGADLQGDAQEAAMEHHVLGAVRAAPGRFFVLLVGNLHASVLPGGGWGKDYRSLGYRLTQQLPAVTALHMTHGPGTAWVCTVPAYGPPLPACGVRPARGRTRAERPFLLHERHLERRGFHGTFYVGSVSASPPVGSAARAAP